MTVEDSCRKARGCRMERTTGGSILPRLLFLFCVVSLSQSSFARPSRTAKPHVPATCRVTRPSDHPFVAPSPYPAQAPVGSFWFGTDRLWTILRTDATWYLTVKTVWWRQDWLGYKSYYVPDSEASKLTVTARQLDSPGPPPKISKLTGSYTEDWKSFLIGAIDFSRPGCWEISAHYEDDDLAFVVWVAK